MHSGCVTLATAYEGVTVCSQCNPSVNTFNMGPNWRLWLWMEVFHLHIWIGVFVSVTKLREVVHGLKMLCKVVVSVTKLREVVKTLSVTLKVVMLVVSVSVVKRLSVSCTLAQLIVVVLVVVLWAKLS